MIDRSVNFLNDKEWENNVKQICFCSSYVCTDETFIRLYNVFIILKILILSIELLYLQNYFRICNNIFENIVNINGQKVDGVQHYIFYLLIEIYSTNQIQYYFLSLI